MIIGASAFGEVAGELFTEDSDYDVVAFAEEREFRTTSTVGSIPVIDFEQIGKSFNPATTSFYCAMVYTQLNRLRTRLYTDLRSLGYAPATYISSEAKVASSATIGEHCFVFEYNNVQSHVSIGNNTVLWSANHIGHHSNIGPNNFVASHAVISGFVTTGANCFVGVNATVANNVNIGDDCWIGLGATVHRDVPSDSLMKGDRSEISNKKATEVFL